jgi:hypothetical protein
MVVPTGSQVCHQGDSEYEGCKTPLRRDLGFSVLDGAPADRTRRWGIIEKLDQLYQDHNVMT